MLSETTKAQFKQVKETLKKITAGINEAEKIIEESTEPCTEARAKLETLKLQAQLINTMIAFYER